MAAGAAVISLALRLLAPQAAGEATIRGRIFNADGQPMPDVVLSAEDVSVERRIRVVSRVVSSDTGGFEMRQLTPGQVLLRAEPGSGASRNLLVSHPPAYFPGVFDRRDARRIDIKAGKIIELDFHMPPVYIGSIKTIVSGPEGFTIEHVRVIRPEGNWIRNVKIADDGVGYADDLREGRYIVSVRGRSRESPLAAFQVVQMRGGETPVTLPLESTARVTGRIIAGPGGLPPIDNVRVVATWTDGNIALDPLARDESYVSADGSFTIDGLFGTRTFQVVGLADGWKVGAVRHGRNDITASGVDLAGGSAIEIAIVLTQPSGAPQFPEPPPLITGTSSIHGRAIDALTGKPIDGAEVRLFDTRMEQERKEVAGRTITTRVFTRAAKTVSGSDGSYAFDGIRDGTYRVVVTHRLYTFSCLGPASAPRPQCDQFTVASDQHLADANVSVQPGGIIRGRVLDKEGQPIEGANVKPEYEPVSQGGANSVTSGADGRFEITSLPPGQMLLRVEPPGGRPAWHRTMYYPGVHLRDEAQLVTAEIGATVDIEIRLREIPTATIRTTLHGPEGFRVRRMTLVNPDTRMLRNVTVSDEGTGSVTDLDEGRYAIAVTAEAGSDTLAAYQLIVVGAAEYDLPMQLEPTATVTGRVIVDRGGAPPVDGVTVEAHWVTDNLQLDLTGPERISVASDGSFTILGLYGRRRFQLFGLPDDWSVTAVRAGRSDVTSGLDLAAGSSTEITIVVSRR
jgi:protocatechuate 3,4-dioxygenase beta subunit